jgi:tetratricopeptide (TPR) repeat protein
MVGLVGLAAAVAVLDVAGAAAWRSTAAVASLDAVGATRRLAESPVLALPEAVRRSRRLVGRELVTAPSSELTLALDRVATLQRRWFVSDPSGFKNAARAALLDGRTEEAVVELRAALERDPTSPTIHRLLAYMLVSRGDRELALDHLAEAAAIAPGVVRPAVTLTESEAAWVRSTGLERALERYPRQRTKTIIALARQLRSDGTSERGRALLTAEPPHPEVELELASWDMREGLFEDALERLDRVAGRSLNPASVRARAWARKAEVLDAKGEPDRAREAAARALVLDPESPAPHLALARLADRRGDAEAALAHLRSAWGLTPTDVRLLNRISAAAEAAGEIGDARLALRRAVELAPESSAQAARLVDFELRHGQYMEAALDLGRFLDRFPTDPTLLRLADRLQQEVTR